jgi:hypothetical protein
MTQEEIRVEAYTYAYNYLVSSQFGISGKMPPMKDILDLAQQIEIYLSYGSNPYGTTGLTLSGITSTGASAAGNSAKQMSPVTNTPIPLTSPNANNPWPAPTITNNKVSSSTALSAHSIMVALDDQVVQDLQNDGMDIIKHLHDHMKDFHRVHHGSGGTTDFTITHVQDDVTTDASGDTLISYVHLVDAITRP